MGVYLVKSGSKIKFSNMTLLLHCLYYSNTIAQQMYKYIYPLIHDYGGVDIDIPSLD